jgi:aminopeptidase
MHDPRFDKLAEVLTNYSVKVTKGDNVWIDISETPVEFTLSLMRAVRKAGGHAFVDVIENRVRREFITGATEDEVKALAEMDMFRMERTQCYIGVRGSLNITETSDIPTERMHAFEQHWLLPVHLEQRVKHTRWVGLRWPTPSMAQLAGMSTEAFENFYFDVCTLDYSRMARAMEPLVELMNKTDRVRLTAEGTDLRFSIKGIPAVACSGEMNIPDGEVFTAPVKDSVEGTIAYNAKTIYRGTAFEGITLKFEQGRIVEATAPDKADKLNEILDTDEGSRFVGEFAIGVNPYITRPMLDILFDEKISGSIHFTPGAAYEDEADNGNRSSVHWDMVLLQDAAAGGGEIWFDDVLIRKDGLFVLDSLKPLNPEEMLKDA